MRRTETSDIWWKSCVVYCLDVETFYDADGDGVGDLEGLAERIDYLAQLGINCLWLMPFYPSPDRDDGYDITDYLGVDPRLGDHGRLLEVIRTAHDRGIRVIADLVVNHTSDQHPWFKEARKSTDNRYRDYYVWRSDSPPDTSAQVVFPDQEDSIWERDDRTGEWYLHHFYKHQPDLNLRNPEVLAEIKRAVGFWLELGFDGFRVDGVPFLGQSKKETGEAQYALDPHDFMKEIRDFLSRRRGDAMMLGEVNLPHAQQLAFFGGEAADELQMQFDFIAMQATYLALARGDARPLVTALRQRPELHHSNQWATFLRNHDELTLDKLTDKQRQEVFDAFGPDEQMQVYDRGLKRRLPPMLDGDPRRVKLAYSLMFSLPGTPTLYYGEEIGMGEDLAADGRMAVRTPMQWTAGRNGGFSTAAPRRLIQRVVPGPFGPEHVNVADQLHDPESLFTWLRRLISIRHSCPELGWGRLQVLEHDAGHGVLAHRVDSEGAGVLAVHNLTADAVRLSLKVEPVPTPDTESGRLSGQSGSSKAGQSGKSGKSVKSGTSGASGASGRATAGPGHPEVVDLLTQADVELFDGTLDLTLDGYGTRWLRLRPAGQLSIP